VYDFACLIAEESNVHGNERQIVEIAALLHDIGIKEAERKYNSSASRYQEQEGPAVARAILEPYHLDAKTVDRICYIIGNHHTYTKIDGIDFQILVEADFIVNIYGGRDETRGCPEHQKEDIQNRGRDPAGRAYVPGVSPSGCRTVFPLRRNPGYFFP
jgi:metal dependent phosphohydrolase